MYSFKQDLEAPVLVPQKSEAFVEKSHTLERPLGNDVTDTGKL
jgi:hypothetical protein